MKKPCFLVLIATLLTFGCSTARTVASDSQGTTNPTWTYRGFEIMGAHSISRETILPLVPIQVGDPYVENIEEWGKICESIRTAFNFYFTECSSVRYSNFDAYFTIEIIEKGHEYRNRYRSNPTQNIELTNAEILTLYDTLYKRLQILFEAGTPANETVKPGFLDFNDPEMHQIAVKLSQLVPQHRKKILKVLQFDQDPLKREKAANLLNWTVKHLDKTIATSSRLLDDPATSVRNNISRFSLHFTDQLRDGHDLRTFINQLLIQLNRPSHADRNKSLYNLLNIAQKFPSTRQYLRENGSILVNYIASTSILSNVKDPASELLRLIEKDVKTK